MCVDHPFHSLYQVYGLMPYNPPVAADKDRRQSGKHSTPAATPPPSAQAAARSEAATEIFNRLRRDPRSEQRIKDVELVAGACLAWAKFPILKTPLDPKQHKSKQIPIPADQPIRKLAGVGVPVLTAPPALDPSLKYDSCVFIEKYEATFETAGGVNLPKICKCVGSDGARYKQLVWVFFIVLNRRLISAAVQRRGERRLATGRGDGAGLHTRQYRPTE